MAQYHAPALDKGLDILEILSANVASQSPVEIASGINRSSNEIYRMLMLASLENFQDRSKRILIKAWIKFGTKDL